MRLPLVLSYIRGSVSFWFGLVARWLTEEAKVRKIGENVSITILVHFRASKKPFEPSKSPKTPKDLLSF